MSLPGIPRPSWYPQGGIHNVTDVANTIRNAFMAGLGSLQGFPYNAISFTLAQVQLAWTGLSVPADLVFSIVIMDPAGNVAGSVTAPVPQAATATIQVPGSYTIEQTYAVEIALVDPNNGGALWDTFPVAQVGGSVLKAGYAAVLQVQGSVGWALELWVAHNDSTAIVGSQISLSILGIRADTGTTFQLYSSTNAGRTDDNGRFLISKPDAFVPAGTYKVFVSVAGISKSVSVTDAQLAAQVTIRIRQVSAQSNSIAIVLQDQNGNALVDWIVELELQGVPAGWQSGNALTDQSGQAIIDASSSPGPWTSGTQYAFWINVWNPAGSIFYGPYGAMFDGSQISTGSARDTVTVTT